VSLYNQEQDLGSINLGFCHDFKRGNNYFEVFGASQCCDKTTKWQFYQKETSAEDSPLLIEKTVLSTRGLQQAFNPQTDEDTGETLIEYGSVSTADQQIHRGKWQKVMIEGKFDNPRVIMGTPTSNGLWPITVRVRDVTQTSFTFQLQGWGQVWSDQELEALIETPEDLSYLVVESGRHMLQNPDGSSTWIEAG
jgi:hypothetical protein